MNKLIAILIFMGFTGIGSAQTTLYYAKLKKEEVPAVVLSGIKEDFPDASVKEYLALPVTIVEDTWFVDTNRDANDKDYDVYEVQVMSKGRDLKATYDKNGDLLSMHEYLRNVELPRPVQVSIGNLFPGWGVGQDKEIMTSFRNGKQKTHYLVRLEKGNEQQKVIFDANGDLIKEREHTKHHRMANNTKRMENKAERREIKKEMNE